MGTEQKCPNKGKLLLILTLVVGGFALVAGGKSLGRVKHPFPSVSYLALMFPHNAATPQIPSRNLQCDTNGRGGGVHSVYLNSLPPTASCLSRGSKTRSSLHHKPAVPSREALLFSLGGKKIFQGLFPADYCAEIHTERNPGGLNLCESPWKHGNTKLWFRKLKSATAICCRLFSCNLRQLIDTFANFKHTWGGGEGDLPLLGTPSGVFSESQQNYNWLLGVGGGQWKSPVHWIWLSGKQGPLEEVPVQRSCMLFA